MLYISEKHQDDVPISDKENVPRLQVEPQTLPDPMGLEQTEAETENVSEFHEDDEGIILEESGEYNNPLEDYQLSRDRVSREIRKPARMKDHIPLTVLSYQNIAFKELKTYEETVSCQLSANQQLAIEEEMDSLLKNNTWTLVPKPQNKSIVDCKQIYNKKEVNSVQQPIRFKARLVTKGFT